MAMASTGSNFPPLPSGTFVGGRDIEMSDESDSEDEETRLQREQAEEDARELQLSRRHGEAIEGRGEKRPQTAEEIQAEYEKKASSKRPKRPALTVDMITGVNGIVRIPVEFKQIPFRGDPKSVTAAAAYSLRLVESYKKFCYDLMPSMAFEDVVLKIEKEGGTRQLKDYLQNMRHAHRDQYLESLYGKEKAEQFLMDLQGLMAEHGDPEFEADYDPHSVSAMEGAEEGVVGGVGDPVTAAGSTSSPGMPTSDTTNPAGAQIRKVSLSSNRTGLIEDDDDDENEFVFDQVDQPFDKESTPADGASKAKSDDGSNYKVDGAVAFQVSKRRRFVLDDSSDEEDDAEDAADNVDQPNPTDVTTLVEARQEEKDDESMAEYVSLLHKDSSSHGAVDKTDKVAYAVDNESVKETAVSEIELAAIQPTSPESPPALPPPTNSSDAKELESPTTQSECPESPVVHSNMAQTQPTQETQSQSLSSSTQSSETATIIGTAYSMQILSSDDENSATADDSSP